MLNGDILGSDYLPEPPTCTPDQRRAAALTLAAHAHDPDELADWLHMLGLHPGRADA